MTRVAFYLRVSTGSQTVENQRLDLQRMAAALNWNVVAEYVDQGVSGSKSRDKRPEFDKLCKAIFRREIDLVAAWSIDRLSRSTRDLLEFLSELNDRNVGLYLLRQNIDTTTASGRMFFTMVAAISEFERALLIERTHAGLARAKAQGKKLGRPSALTPAKETKVRELLAGGMGIMRAAKIAGIGTSTAAKIKARMAA